MLDAMPTDESGELSAMQFQTLLHVYEAWRYRHVRVRPRRAHLARELVASPDLNRYERVLGAIVKCIEAGADLTAHLSTSVEVAHQPGSSEAGGSRRDRDLLLADWGIHHLHLSDKLGHNGFVHRTADVLFVAFQPHDAYLIGIYPHPKRSNWAKQAILTALVRNWPDAGVVLGSKVAVGLSHEWNDDERLKLREAGVSTAIIVDGRVYGPFGQTIGGTPSQVAPHVMKVIAILDGWRRAPDELDRMIASHEEHAPEAASGDGDWEPFVADDAFGVRKNRLFVRIGTLTYPGHG